MEEIDGGEDADSLQLLADEDEAENCHEDDQLGLEEVDRHVDTLQAGILEDIANLRDSTLTDQVGERNLPAEHLDRAQAWSENGE